MTSWPWAPMLNRPARKASATPRPAQISGAARSRVVLMAASEPTEPVSRAQYDDADRVEGPRRRSRPGREKK